MILLKKKKPASPIRFEPGSKLPLVFYAVTAIILSCIFMIITLATSGFSFTLGRELDVGDINNDGKINACDALKILQRDGNKADFSGAQIDAADLNGDGVINALDATLIVQYASETSDKLGVLAVGNTRLEKFPTTVPADNATDTAENTDGTGEDGQTETEASYVKIGNSDFAAFCTTEAEIYTSANLSNIWISNGKYFYQIDITLTNRSNGWLADSNFELQLSGAAVIEKTWSCYAQDSDFGINITTQNNTYVPNGGSMKCGLVVSSGAPLTIESVTA